MKPERPLRLWSACDLALAIRTGKITCRLAVSSVIERMRGANPHLNAVVIDLSEQALTEAQRADDMVRRGDRLGSLHGVPVTINVLGLPAAAVPMGLDQGVP